MVLGLHGCFVSIGEILTPYFPEATIKSINIIPAGHYQEPHLPGRRYWLSTLWWYCLGTILISEKQAALVQLNLKNSRERDRCDRRRLSILKISGKVSAGVVIGAATGAAIGLVGGPAMPIMTPLGAAVGSVIGGTIAAVIAKFLSK